jgi:hypothetical protein
MLNATAVGLVMGNANSLKAKLSHLEVISLTMQMVSQNFIGRVLNRETTTIFR